MADKCQQAQNTQWHVSDQKHPETTIEIDSKNLGPEPNC